MSKHPILSGAGGGGCFRAGTQVQLEHGKTEAIENLSVGDEVLAFDEHGAVHLAKVTKVHHHVEPQPILRVKFWRGETHITPNHWVLNQYGNFTEMGRLSTHDALVDGMGHLRPILSAEVVGYEPVWNLTVEPHHTFIADGIRVHNGGHRERYPVVAGAGGDDEGKGGGGGAAVEDPDSLQSRAMIQILELLGEGQIGGLVAGAQSIYLNDTPLQNSDGSYNFSGVTWDHRVGTQDQVPVAGFDSINTPFNEGVQVKLATPYTVTITNPNANQCRVIVTIPSLMQQDMTTGDVTGTTVQYKFSVSASGGPFVDVPADYAWSVGGTWATIDGHLTATPTTSATGVSAKVSLLGEGTMTVQPQYEIGGGWYNLGAALPMSVRDGTGDTGISVTGPSGSTRLRFVVTASAGAEIPTWYDGLGMYIGSTITPPPTLSGSEIQSYTPTPVCTLTGKTRSRYQRAHLIPLIGTGPWQLRMTRITPDAGSAAVSNETYFDSYVEIVNTRMSYPNSALVAVSIDSAQFSQIPNRAYLVDGLYIRVPSNYNPQTRVYTGVWSGTFNVAVSNNPAWVLYDLLTNARYGLGQHIAESQIDKASLYQIGRYCDEMVPDGQGRMEPRFTCNTAIQTQAEAYKLVSDLCSVMRGMAFWDGNQVGFTQDSPADPSMIFSPANVVDGVFNYTGSSRKDRHSVAMVTWNDPLEFYKQKIEYVENADMIARYGLRKIETVAFGCTSRGQAHRVGKWMLYTEQYESDLVQFKVGLDAALVGPGEIVKIHDPFRAGKRMGGRLLDCTTFTATLDAPVTLSGDESQISVRLPDGTFTERTLLEGAGTHSVVSWAAGLPELPVANGVWLIAEADLQPMLARVLAVAQDGQKPGQFLISAVEHNPGKFDAIEQGIQLEEVPTSLISTAPGSISDLQLNESLYLITPAVVGTRALVTWGGTAKKYRIVLQDANGFRDERETTVPSVTYDNLPPGVYDISVRPYGMLGQAGAAATLRAEVFGKTTPPADVSGFGMTVIASAAYLNFNPASDLDVQVGGHLRLRHSATMVGATWNDAVDIGAQVPGNATSAILPLLAGTYLAKWVDSSGFESASAALVVTNAPSVIGMNIVEEIDEAPAFAGARDQVAVSAWVGQPALVLDSMATIGEMLTPVSTWPELAVIGGGSAPSGTYEFDTGIDLGEVVVSRLTSHMVVHAYDAADRVGVWPNISSLLSISGAVIGDVSAQLQVRTTDDDPVLEDWSGWQPFYVGDWAARAFQFRAVLSRVQPMHNIAVTELSVQVDMPDRLHSGDDIACPDTGISVTFPTPFYVAPAVAITGQGMQTGDYFEITNKDRFGFDLIFRDNADAGVARTFDFMARSY